MPARDRIPREEVAATGLLALSMFLVGLSASAVTPFRAVVAVEVLGLSNGAYAAILSFNAFATAVVSLVLGRLSDRIGDRRNLVILSALAGALAWGLTVVLPSKLTYLVSLGVILPFGGALFSQSFAFSRAFFDRAAPSRVVMMTAMLRTLFSAAWIVVPPLAGWIAGVGSVIDVFAFAAIGHLGVAFVFGILRARPGARVPPAPRPEGGVSGWRLLGGQRLTGLGRILAIRTAMVLHLTLLPLAMLNDLGGDYSDVGVTAALAAGLEVPLMLGWGYLAGRVKREGIIVANALLYGAYLAAMTLARGPLDVLWLQVPNAIATAALMGLTISYVQDSIHGQVGLSTAILDVMTVLATSLAAVSFRMFSGEASYLAGFLAAAGASVVGACLLAIAQGPRRRR